MQTVTSILGYRDVDERGADIEGGSAGILHHELGVGHVVINLNDGEAIYMPCIDLASFARLYARIGIDAIAAVEIQELTREKAAERGLIAKTAPPSLVYEMLSLVVSERILPHLSEIQDWSEEERALASEWAAATHLKESDDDLVIPPVPEILVGRSR